MNRSLVALWSLLATAIVTIAILTQLWIAQRGESSKQRVRDILQTQLVPLNESVDRVLKQYSSDLQASLSGHDLADPSDCLGIARFPIAQSIVVVDPMDRLHYPLPSSILGIEESSIVAESLELLRDYGDPRPKPSGQAALANELAVGTETPPSPARPKLSVGGEQSNNRLRSRSYQLPPSPTNSYQQNIVPGSLVGQAAGPAPRVREAQDASLAADLANAVPGPEDTGARSQADESQEYREGGQQDSDFEPRAGWVTWYHRRGMILGFLWNQPNGYRSMIVLPRARWMADIVGSLPSSEVPGAAEGKGKLAVGLDFSTALKQLVDIEGNVVYQWGNTPAEAWLGLSELAPDAELPVAEPLEGWRLRIFANPRLSQQLAGDSIILPLWLGVAGLSLALLVGGVLVTLSLNRQVALAERRVSFVNHVSHELRTPLTNIRMYADMLASSLDDPTPEAMRQLERVEVIQHESQRLSRLITNVLHFARSGSERKRLQTESVVVDDLVNEVVDSFRPRLAAIGMEVELALGTPNAVMLDRDAAEQILVNLVGNAEKYASSGNYLRIVTCRTDAGVEIEVQDRGPGIPKRLASVIFQPFTRGSNRLQDPAGTGIGLTIARELANNHGGHCELSSNSGGATFRVSLAEISNGS